MAQLTATVTVEKVSYEPNLGYRNFVSIAVGDGSNTYGTGIAITGQDLGLPAGVIFGINQGLSNTGLVARYDAASAKIKLYESDTTGDTDKALVELDSGDTPAAMTIKAEACGY